MIVIEFLGAKVVPKGAPRHVVRQGIAWTYITNKEREYAAALRRIAMQKMDGEVPIAGPVMLDLTVYIEPPASMSKLERRRALAGLEYPDKRPDLDNYTKMVSDCLTAVVWIDDNQVVSLNARKRYGDTPGIRAEIEEIKH